MYYNTWTSALCSFFFPICGIWWRFSSESLWIQNECIFSTQSPYRRTFQNDKSQIQIYVVYFTFHMQLCSFPSPHLLVCSVTNTQRWTHQGQSGGTKPPYQTLMLSLSFCDKDLQPVRANCQKLLAFTSEFLGLVYVCEPRDRLACGARPRTNRLWHRLCGAQLQSHLLLHGCECARAHTRARVPPHGFDSAFCCAMHHTLESKVSKWWQIGNMCNQLSGANEPLSVSSSLGCGFYLTALSTKEDNEGNITADPQTVSFRCHMKQLSGLETRRSKSYNQAI